MTNFEKWKQELTPEEMSEIMLKLPSCIDCPAQKLCYAYGGKCEDGFVKWANSPVKESDKK